MSHSVQRNTAYQALSRATSISLFTGLTILAVSTHSAAQPKSSVMPELKIQLLTIFDHAQLLTWPPEVKKREITEVVRQKLASHLNVILPNTVVATQEDHEKILKSASADMDRGRIAYENLNHRLAAKMLEKALSQYASIDFHLVKPEQVADVLLLLGKTRLEQGMETEGERLFRQAFELQPTIKLRPDFEHPNTVTVLSRARRSFLTRAPDRPAALGTASMRGARVYIHGRLIQSRLELVIRSNNGIRIEVEPIDNNLDSAISRIASRIIDCLPLKDQVALAPSVFKSTVGVGLGASLYSSSPVGPFPIFDAMLYYARPLSQNIELWIASRISTSGRDPSAHLRTPLSAGSVTFGPRPKFSLGRLSGTTYVLPWVGRQGAVEITTNPACKFFSAETSPPSALCNHEVDVERFGPSWLAGIEIGAGLLFPLRKRFFMGVNAAAQFKLLEEVDSDFKYLYRGNFTLAYQL